MAVNRAVLDEIAPEIYPAPYIPTQKHGRRPVYLRNRMAEGIYA